MGKKVFVSYKHSDSSVQSLTGYCNNTVRDYVDYLINNTLKNDVYKGEGDEDLSDFKDGTIENHLKNKIHDSSITIVLISPNMKDLYKSESDQWIPWEISYSLKEIKRSDKTSYTNGILTVVLPDMKGSYDYFLKEGTCNVCNSRAVEINILFQILKKNMFNAKVLKSSNCRYCNSYAGGSYIESVKWKDFISNKDFYLDKAIEIMNDRKSYNITKEVQDNSYENTIF
ncbi:TIR domain-containing protein [Bathymodiolus thermophilus thioautotrophic gill symbiont]|uniref:Thoeris protein ThsB TIR-like domain-containing protein n=1 Tax=Bathymodiolus thermophilus thioautotrophic gill symbiont TaxID=2360 RepID=A0A8H8XFR3_9GAMM|nr:TIR domain-containing protein [Bathymodiolus thermophilus thioautotrophic gill symbiont]CAB5506424.1 hypothetical protein THERMOS_2317 [Bathymodiolus thermophilus thioautotrophic gill symbiont]